MRPIDQSRWCVLVENLRADRHIRCASLVVMATHLGLPAEAEHAAWARSRERGVGFGDAFCAELVLCGSDWSELSVEALNYFRPHRALNKLEVSNLLDTRAHGSRVRLGRMLNCDRKTIRRLLRAEGSGVSTSERAAVEWAQNRLTTGSDGRLASLADL